MHGTPDEQLRETERVLRLLMKDASPRPTTPADHMDQVGRRIRQRRRKRVATAGAAASVVAAVAYTAIAPVRWASDQDDTTASAASASSHATRDLTTVRLPNLSGLALRVPQGWVAASSEDSEETHVSFVSSQPLHEPPHDSCSVDQDKLWGACPPITALDKGGALMAFQDTGVNALSDMMPLVLKRASPDEHCRALMGDTQMKGVGRARASGSGEPFDVEIFVCLRAPSDQTLAAVGKALETAFPQSQG